MGTLFYETFSYVFNLVKMVVHFTHKLACGGPLISRVCGFKETNEENSQKLSKSESKHKLIVTWD
jgi:hypothetical protein